VKRYNIFKKYIFLPTYEKLKKPPSKVAQKNSNPFFSLLPELPKQKKLCSKIWLIDQLYAGRTGEGAFLFG
jgi:hypothetical protein